jgi:acylglycerol lipase
MSVKGAEEFLKMSDGFNLFCRSWKPVEKTERTVVCIHGFGGHSGCFRLMGRSLADDGIEVLGLDLRGFGNSKEQGLPRGDTKDFKRHMQDLDEAVSLIRKRSQMKLYLLGHSLGGLYTLWYGAKYPSSLDGLILAAPTIEVKPRISLEDRNKLPFLLANAPETMIGAKKASLPDIEESGNVEIQAQKALCTTSFSARYIAGIGATLMRDNAFINAAKVKKPTLIIQGESDEEALPTGAKRLFEGLAAEDKTIKMIPGADHTLHNAILTFASTQANLEKENK